MNDYRRILVWMAFFVAALLAAAALVAPRLRSAFEANVALNGLILGVLALGILIDFGQVIGLGPAARWLRDVERGATPAHAPRLLSPLARVLAGEGANVRISMPAMRSLLDGVRLRLDESRDVSRYLVGLLIFLGLLGTFWGLLGAIGAVGGVIQSLTGDASGDAVALFASLQRELQRPLSGMATAFSSSLFGVAGALAMGVLDLQAGHAQNRFYSRLEEWMAGLARLPGALGVADGEHALPRYVEALLEHTAESLSQLQRMLGRGEETRAAQQAIMASLAERLAALTDQLRGEQKLLVALARTQSDLEPAMAELATHVGRGREANEEIRRYLRNVDLSLARLVEEVRGARDEMSGAVRQEARMLAQSLGSRARGG